jgi:hypothetical protein
MSSLFAVLAGVLASAVPAAAEVRPGSVTDPAGDGASDIVGAEVSFDTAGSVTARVTFSGVPAPADPNELVIVRVGSFSGTTCYARFRLGGYVGDGSAAGQAAWQVPSTGAQGAGTRSRDGATITLSASDPALTFAEADCFYVDTAGDETDVARVGTAPPPAPEPPAPAPDPAPEPAPQEDPVPPAPKPTAIERYDAAVAACPKRKGKARTSCLSRAKQRNRAGYLESLKRRRNPFYGQAFFRPDVDVAGVCGGSCLTGMVFVDSRWAYRGEPEDGPVLVRCTKVTATGDDDGCLRYTLSKDRRTATVGGVRYRLTKDRKAIEGSGDAGRLTRVAIPRAGTRVQGELSSISSFGIVGVNQTFSTSELVFSRDGRFASDGSVASFLNQGSDFESSVTALPPGRRGRYAFEPGGTLALTFDDGRVSRRSAFVAFGAKNTLGSIERDGLFLNGAFYRPPDED